MDHFVPYFPAPKAEAKPFKRGFLPDDDPKGCSGEDVCSQKHPTGLDIPSPVLGVGEGGRGEGGFRHSDWSELSYPLLAFCQAVYFPLQAFISQWETKQQRLRQDSLNSFMVSD